MRMKSVLWVTLLFVIMSAAVYATGQPVFPLTPDATGRYFVDQQNQPFFYQADTPWHLPFKLSKTEIENEYLPNRAAKGFTVIQVMVVFNGEPTNREGQRPFYGTEDITNQNPLYFDFIKWVCNKAEERGMMVAIAPLWLQQMPWQNKYQDTAAMRNYGEFLGSHFSDTNNITWILGGDYPLNNFITGLRAMGEGIHQNAPHHLITAHGSQFYDQGEATGGTFFQAEPWYDFNFSYSWIRHFIVKVQYREWNRSPAKPTLLGEARYDDDPNSGHVDAYWIRQQAYYSVLSGIAGHAYGQGRLWYIPSDWRNKLDTEAGRHMEYVQKVFRDHEWYRMLPDQSQMFLTGGYESGDTLAVAAAAPDGSLGMAFMPTVRTITIDMSRLSGDIEASWYDPTDGVYEPIGSFPSTGSRQFTPPGNNSGGKGDWILVLQGASLQAPVLSANLNGNVVELSWTDPNSGDQQETGFEVQRRPYSGQDQWTTLDILGEDVTEHTDSSALYGMVQYHYRVGAYR